MLNGVPALQLGIQLYRVPIDALPKEQRGSLEYGLLRIGSTFGRNKFKIIRGRVDLKFKSDLQHVVVHDLYPRREEQIDRNALEIGLNSDLTWGTLGVTPSIKYRTTIQRINTFLSAGGLLDSHAWWRFSLRKGEHSIEGSMETLLTLQFKSGEKITGEATLHGEFDRWGGRTTEPSFVFRI